MTIWHRYSGRARKRGEEGLKQKGKNFGGKRGEKGAVG